MRRKIYTAVLAALSITTGLIVHSINVYKESKQPWNLPQEPDPGISPDTERRMKNPSIFQTAKVPPKSSFAEHALYVVNVPSKKLWSHVPLLYETVLSIYPHKRVFSDSGAVIGGNQVIDAISHSSSALKRNSSHLESYQVRRYGLDQDWGWPPDEYWQGDLRTIMQLVRDESVKEAQKALTPDIEWIIFADAHSYVSPYAFDMVPPKGDMRLSNGVDNDILIISRDTLLKLDHGGGGLSELPVYPVNSISGTKFNKANWCDPVYAFNGLDRWESQSIFSRDIKSKQTGNDHLYSGVYKDYLSPFIAPEKMNWKIDPTGPAFVKQYEGELVSKSICRELCEKDESCSAWQWHETFDCYLETKAIRRGIAMNHLHKENKPNNPMMFSGWMIDRVRQIRLDAECDNLQMTADNEPNDATHLQEGWWKDMRDRIRFDGSDVLQSLESYEKDSESSAESN